jgi:ribonuclease P protein component
VERLTFKEKDRIKSKGDFDRLRKSGIRLADGTFAVVILPTPNGFSRLGISVPKRIGGAVFRNRIKRLIREVFRLHRDGLPSSVDLLVIVKKTPERATYAELSDRILFLVKRYHGPDGLLPRPRAG